jgi:hypothetical protein
MEVQSIWPSFEQDELGAREIAQRLSNLSEALENHCRNINNGGCCVIAAITGMALLRLHVEVEVVPVAGVAPAKIRNYVNDNTSPSEWENNGLDLGHLGLRFKLEGCVYYWDSEGFHGNDGDPYHKFRRSPKEFGSGLRIEEACSISLLTGRGWNKMFNREQIPLMTHLVFSCVILGLKP